ncbi:MAG TPA: GGDEF domain-containing protein, partial [Spirochaetota bacterium]
SHYTYDDKGNFIREYGVLRDITGKKLIETELTIFATTDILTDVFNRRVGITMLKQQLHQSLRNKKKMVICFIDVNGLKKINDTYGHKEGDRLIVSVADVLKKCARNSDIIARMGGDEFLYVLTDCDTKGADKAWDRVTAEFDLINSSGKNKYTISASKGFAELDPKEPKSADELIALADANMYEDKRLYKEKNH